MPFSIDKYIHERVDNQIDWYDNKSIKAQRNYKRIQLLEIVFAAAIPVLTTFVGWHWIVATTIALLGAAIVVLQGINRLNNYHENWIAYRTTCELLRNEKNLFQSGSAPYNSVDETEENVFVRRIEALISSENNQWKSSQQITEKERCGD